MTSSEDHAVVSSDDTEDSSDVADFVPEFIRDGDVSRRQLAQLVSIAIVLSFPFLKILYVTESSAIAGEVIRLHGPAGWVNVLIDNVLRYPLLFLVLFVLISNSRLFEFLGDASRRLLTQGTSPQRKRYRFADLLNDLVGPAIGFFWALALFGLGWAVATALAALAYRLPTELDLLRNVVRVRRNLEPIIRDRRVTLARTVLFRVTAFGILPLSVLYPVLDGEAWQSVRLCEVASATQGDHVARIVEIHRGGQGITTAWEIGTSNTVSGTGCVDSPFKVRDAFWE